MKTDPSCRSLEKRIAQVAAILIALALLGSCGTTDYTRPDTVSQLSVALSEKHWDGVRIPTGQQCIKFAGHGASPTLIVSNIPKGAEAIIVEFSDRSWFPMNHGGHGKLGIKVKPGQHKITIPSVPGETFNLPQQNLFIFQPHRGGRGKPGAYLPPCSGGRGNQYFADVKAVRKLEINNQTAELLAEGSLFLGSY